jgi:hypothetical protein
MDKTLSEANAFFIEGFALSCCACSGADFRAEGQFIDDVRGKKRMGKGMLNYINTGSTDCI